VTLTHPAVHEEALFQLRASSRDISIFDSRESLTGRPSIGSISLLYANTASRIAETWASRLAGCGCPYIFTWHRLLCCKLFDELSPALTTNTKLIDVDQCGMLKREQQWQDSRTVSILPSFAILPLDDSRPP
jgi:hypothetical protein